MADENDFADYPKPKFALGAGDLIDALDGSISFEDGERVIATLRANPSGSTGGGRSATATIKSAVSHAGLERDYMTPYRQRKVMQLRYKIPGLVFTITGRLTKPQITGSVDNAIEFTFSVTGSWTVAPA